MAQSTDSILSKILGVVSKINAREEYKEKKENNKSDAGTGSLFDLFLKNNSSENYNSGSKLMSDTLKFITGISKIKDNSKTINKTSTALKGLFEVIFNMSKNEKSVENAVKLMTSISQSFESIGNFSKSLSELLFSIGGSILLISGSMLIAGKMLGTNGAIETTLAITGVITGMVGLMYLISKATPYVKEGVKTTNDMGKALTYLSGGLLSFVVSLEAISVILKLGTGPEALAIGVGIMAAVVAGTGVMFYALDKFDKPIKNGADVAKKMGTGMIFISGGILAFATTLDLVSLMFGNRSLAAVAKSLLIIMGAVGGMAISFALIGSLKNNIQKGTVAMGLMALGLGIMSVGILAVAMISSYLTKLGDSDKIKNSSHTTGFGKMMAAVGPGLGLFGGIIISSALLLAALGIPEVAGLIALGSIAAAGIAGVLILLAYSVKKLVETAKGLNGEDIQKTVGGLIGGVVGGFVEGIGNGLSNKESGLKGLANSIKGMAVITTGIGLLMGISVSLSMFAMALSAFAKLDNMKVIEGYDSKGKPIFGKTINIKNVGQQISTTIGDFLHSLIESTQKLKFGQAYKIQQLAMSLSGRHGILSAVIQFADVLKVFSEFGPAGKIGYVDIVQSGTDADGNPHYKYIRKSVKIKTVATNIANSFGTFVDELTSHSGMFEVTGEKGKAMGRLAEILMGTEATEIFGWKFGKPKPGLLAPINKFAALLNTYAKFGNDKSIPITDASGKILLDGNGNPKTARINDIASNIATSISYFATALSNNLSGGTGNTEKANKQINKYMGLITKMGELAKAEVGLNKTAVAIKSLASSIDSLSTSLIKLNVDKLNVIRNAGLTAVVKNYPEESVNTKVNYLNQPNQSVSNPEETIFNPPIDNQVSPNSELLVELKRLRMAYEKSNEYLDKQLPISIAQSVSAALKTAQFHFEFANDKSGILSME